MTNSELLGRAIDDYFGDKFVSPFEIYYPDLEPDEMPIEVFFRSIQDMPEIEKYALSLVKGSVLDIGAGAGAHSLALLASGMDVTALDNSEASCSVMQSRGIKNVILSDIHDYSLRSFDTLLLLMNGIGLARSIDGLKTTLTHLNSLLNNGGQVLFDSSDLKYLERKTESYYGEMKMRYIYKGLSSEWDSWLYIDPYTLIQKCEEWSIPIEIIIEDDTGLFLARMPKWE